MLKKSRSREKTCQEVNDKVVEERNIIEENMESNQIMKSSIQVLHNTSSDHSFVIKSKSIL